MNELLIKNQKFKSLSTDRMKYNLGKKLFALPLNYWDSNVTIPLKELSNPSDGNNNNGNNNQVSTEIDFDKIFYTIQENKPLLRIIHPNWNIDKGDYIIKSRVNRRKFVTKNEFRILIVNFWLLLLTGFITILLLSIIKDF